MTELKPCPFCGGEPILEKAVMPNGKDEPIKLFKYKCRKCGVAEFGWPLSEEIAVEHWNRRINETKPGHWNPSLTGYPFCSNCNWCPEEDDMTHGWYNYCPSCGARMDNGSEYF